MPKGERNRKLSDHARARLVQRYTTPNADGTWDGCKILAIEFGISVPAVLWNLRRADVEIRDKRTAHSNGKRTKPLTNDPVGLAPLCQCGCGQTTRWERPQKRWQKYAPGHYQPHGLHRERDWLEMEYTIKQRTATEIAQECGVAKGTVLRSMRLLGIARRPQRESLIISGAVRGYRNGSFKDGRAKWEYSYEWKRLSREIRKRDGYRCQLCGVYLPPPSKRLHVHHIDSDRFNNTDSNLITVCATCHPKSKQGEQALAESLQ